MNILQGLQSPHTYCVTLNDAEGIDPALVLGRYTYHHPVYTTEGRAAQQRVDEVIDVNRTSFCGAYWGIRLPRGWRPQRAARQPCPREGGGHVNSCLYEGLVGHRRFAPTENAFRYALFMVYLDLDELDEVFRGRWLWSTKRPALAWFRRRDHLGDPAVPLDTAVRDLVEERGHDRPTGRIRLLTHLRYFGYCMNPVSFYYCFDEADQRVETIVAEVHNTPWGEQHCNVLRADEQAAAGARHRFRFAKDFHVSPFMGMDQQYDWTFGEPGIGLAVRMRTNEDNTRMLDASMGLRRRPISAGSLARALVRYPFMTAKVVVAIYYQALRLHLKRIPFHAHPKHAIKVEASTS